MVIIKDKYYFFISEEFEQFDNDSHALDFKRQFEEVGINNTRSSIIGTLCIDILNSYDNLIRILDECIKLTNKPFYRFENYLKSKIDLINQNILEIIIYELDSFHSKQCLEVYNSQSDLRLYKRELTLLKKALESDTDYNQYYDSLIKDAKQSLEDNNINELDEEDKRQREFDQQYLEDLEKEKEDNKVSKKSITDSIKTTEEDIERELKCIKNYDEIPLLLKEYIEKMIQDIITYKDYIDVFFSFLDEKSYTKQSLDYFQAMFSSKFVLPKTYIYNAFEKYSFIKPINNLLITLAEETGERNIEILKKSVLNTLKNSNTLYCKLYEINSLEDIFNIYLSLLMEHKLVINKCKNCGKYFIPDNRSDEKYCSNPSPQNSKKTCKEYGAKKTYRDKQNSNIIRKSHYNTSQFFRMKAKRAKTENEQKQLNKLFEKYKVNYEKQLKKYKNKKITEDEFVNWITSQKGDLKNGNKRTNKK